MSFYFVTRFFSFVSFVLLCLCTGRSVALMVLRSRQGIEQLLQLASGTCLLRPLLPRNWFRCGVALRFQGRKGYRLAIPTSTRRFDMVAFLLRRQRLDLMLSPTPFPLPTPLLASLRCVTCSLLSMNASAFEQLDIFLFKRFYEDVRCKLNDLVKRDYSLALLESGTCTHRFRRFSNLA